MRHSASPPTSSTQLESYLTRAGPLSGLRHNSFRYKPVQFFTVRRLDHFFSVLLSVLKNMGAPVKSNKAVHGVAIALRMADGIPTERR